MSIVDRHPNWLTHRSGPIQRSDRLNVQNPEEDRTSVFLRILRKRQRAVAQRFSSQEKRHGSGQCYAFRAKGCRFDRRLLFHTVGPWQKPVFACLATDDNFFSLFLSSLLRIVGDVVDRQKKKALGTQHPLRIFTLRTCKSRKARLPGQHRAGQLVSHKLT